MYIQPKNSPKVQIICILEEIDSLYDQKCTSWKGAKIWAGPSLASPSFEQCPKACILFLKNASLSSPTPSIQSIQPTFCLETRHKAYIQQRSNLITIFIGIHATVLAF